MPDGQSWEFEYDDPGDGSTYNDAPVNYGTLTKVTMPTGGSISYTYATVPPESTLCQQGGRWIASRSVNANDGLGSHTWTYTYNTGYTVVTDPLLNDVVHTFGWGAGCQQHETQTQYYQGSYTQGPSFALKTVTTTYSGSWASQNTQSNGMAVGTINVVPISVVTSWKDGQTSQVTKSYDSISTGVGGFTYTDYMGSQVDLNGATNAGIYGKEVSESNYDYGNGAAGSLLRTINTKYQAFSGTNASSYLTNNLLSLPYSVQTLDASSAQVALATYGYDESGLRSSGVSEQKTTGESHPGNQTSVHRWLNGSTVSQSPCSVSVSNGYVVSNDTYYNTGEVQQNSDPCGYATTYQYSSAAPYYGAFLTKVTNTLSQDTTYGYDSNTGAVTSIKDENSQITTKSYDILTRLTSVSYPDGGSTSYCYTDMGGSTCSKSGAPYEVVVPRPLLPLQF